MFCPRCGFNNVDTANFCGGCALTLSPGRPPAASPPPPMPPPPPPPPGPAGATPFGAPRAGWGQTDPYGAPGAAEVRPHWSGMAIAGFVVSFFCGVLGLVFSIMGYRECKEGEGRVRGEGLAIAGMVISIMMIIYAINVALR